MPTDIVIILCVAMVLTCWLLIRFKAPQSNSVSLWSQDVKPFWFPDAQGFAIGAIILIAASALFMRMLRTTNIEDKMLDTMITIVFSTCLVATFQYLFGSSRGSSAKDDTQNRLVDKLLPPNPTSPAVPPPVVVAWWSALSPDEQAALEAAAVTDPKVRTFIDAAKVGKANADDLAYLVSKIPPLLTQERATALAAL